MPIVDLLIMSNPISGGAGGIENRFSVPPKQWNDLGPEGQEHFNRLFMKVQRKKPAWLKNQPFTEKQLQQNGTTASQDNDGHLPHCMRGNFAGSLKKIFL
jgi:hypothetical protein